LTLIWMKAQSYSDGNEVLTINRIAKVLGDLNCSVYARAINYDYLGFNNASIISLIVRPMPFSLSLL
jgi:hypothetical protein